MKLDWIEVVRGWFRKEKNEGTSPQDVTLPDEIILRAAQVEEKPERELRRVNDNLAVQVGGMRRVIQQDDDG